MNSKSFVKLSNVIAIISILLLVYWVFIFISIEVFGLKVFKENITETFYLSILGILALMSGALILNIMFNLTRIAEKHNQDENLKSSKKSKSMVILFVLSFPFIFAFLYTGDYFTSKKKEKMLVDSAESIINDNYQNALKLLNYEFSEKWIVETENIIDVLSSTDKHFPNVTIIVKDSINNTPVFMGFNHYSGSLNDTIQPLKVNFLIKTTKAERIYLADVFENRNGNKRFSAYDGKYELYYPFMHDKKIVVFYFAERQRYGKIGS